MRRDGRPTRSGGSSPDTFAKSWTSSSRPRRTPTAFAAIGLFRPDMEASMNRLGSAALAADPARLPARVAGQSPFDLTRLPELSLEDLRHLWRRELGKSAPERLPKWLLARLLAYRLQVLEDGDLSRETIRMLNEIADQLEQGKKAS